MASSQQPDQQNNLGAAALGVGGLLAVDRIRRLYTAAESRALQALRNAVARVLRAPAKDSTARFDSRWRLDREAGQVANQVATESVPAIERTVLDAHNAGVRAAERDLGLPAAPAAQRVPIEVEQQAAQIHVEHQRLVSVVHEQYQLIIDKAVAAETGRLNRQRVAQRALDEFASRGISVFVDKAGRQWSISAYVEMVVRTVAAEAQRSAYLDRIQAAGITWVRISVSPTCCPLCKPYDGKLMPISELGAAREAGLFHPQCRHLVTAAKAGQHIPRMAPPPDMDHYRAEQRLRYLERRVRAARRREAVALDPQALRKARAELNAAWAAIREHVEKFDLTRQRAREQIIRARG